MSTPTPSSSVTDVFHDVLTSPWLGPILTALFLLACAVSLSAARRRRGD